MKHHGGSMKNGDDGSMKHHSDSMKDNHEAMKDDHASTEQSGSMKHDGSSSDEQMSH